MPLTRISVSQNVFERCQSDISAILQHCLETHFDVPSGDCFQLFDIHQPQQKVFDVRYPNLRTGRSDDAVLFHIIAGKPRSHAQKRALYQALCQHLQRNTNLSEEDIMVIIQFNQAEDWSFSSGHSWQDEMEATQ
ncbi:tautomerase family protein [Vibrio fluvialis]|uniref:tautomerase family protein n=1 Tax=Vibrio fluvialis TaxID=676 RepID=UPI001C9CE7C5|nr:tautomerase family protein [Vibrio fluvialis]